MKFCVDAELPSSTSRGLSPRGSSDNAEITCVLGSKCSSALAWGKRAAGFEGVEDMKLRYVPVLFSPNKLLLHANYE